MKLRRIAPILAISVFLSLPVLTGCTETPSSTAPESDPTAIAEGEAQTTAEPPTENATGDAPTAQAPQSVPSEGGMNNLDVNQQPLSVYWLGTEGNELELVPTPVSQTTQDKSETATTEIKSAVDILLAGPSSEQHTTTIPASTKLLELSVQEDGVHINLSPEFTTGGGTASMKGRVAQLLYTVTSGNPQEQVWLSVSGEPLEVLGGEGLMLDQPLTRQNFEENFGL